MATFPAVTSLLHLAPTATSRDNNQYFSPWPSTSYVWFWMRSSNRHATTQEVNLADPHAMARLSDTCSLLCLEMFMIYICYLWNIWGLIVRWHICIMGLITSVSLSLFFSFFFESTFWRQIPTWPVDDNLWLCYKISFQIYYQVLLLVCM